MYLCMGSASSHPLALSLQLSSGQTWAGYPAPSGAQDPRSQRVTREVLGEEVVRSDKGQSGHRAHTGARVAEKMAPKLKRPEFGQVVCPSIIPSHKLFAPLPQRLADSAGGEKGSQMLGMMVVWPRFCGERTEGQFPPWVSGTGRAAGRGPRRGRAGRRGGAAGRVTCTKRIAADPRKA